MSVQRLLERKYDVVVVITHLVTNHTVLDVQLAMLALIQMQSLFPVTQVGFPSV
jgi:hypothetical protein